MITLWFALRTTLAEQMCSGNAPVMNSAPTVGVPANVVAVGSRRDAAVAGETASIPSAATTATAAVLMGRRRTNSTT
jgi:hypothetical protein